MKESVLAPQGHRGTVMISPPVGQGSSALAQGHFGWDVSLWRTVLWGIRHHPWPLPTR